jgi:hypothetical protein
MRALCIAAKYSRLRRFRVIFDRSGQSCLPVHVRIAPKADLRLGATGTRRDEVGADLHLTANWTLTAKLDGEFANGSQTYAGTGTLRYTWSCSVQRPLQSESDRVAARQRNDAMRPRPAVSRCSKTSYSITSSAVTSRAVGMVSPSALAALRLTTISNLTGA